MNTLDHVHRRIEEELAGDTEIRVNLAEEMGGCVTRSNTMRGHERSMGGLVVLSRY